MSISEADTGKQNLRKVDVEYVYVSIRYVLFFFFLSSRLACVKCPVYHVLLAVTTLSIFKYP